MEGLLCIQPLNQLLGFDRLSNIGCAYPIIDFIRIKLFVRTDPVAVKSSCAVFPHFWPFSEERILTPQAKKLNSDKV
jgi:hypothetical protein